MDTNYSGGFTSSTNSRILGTPTPGLYATGRVGQFEYQFTVPPGTYLVRLRFAEIWYDSPGLRLFDAVINGQPALTAFDIVAAAGGPNRAVDREFIVTPADGQIRLEWKAVVDNPKVSAIEILPHPGGASGLRRAGPIRVEPVPAPIRGGAKGLPRANWSGVKLVSN